MKRTAIYARFSSDLQRDRSIEDQVALCRDYASRNGLKIVAEYDDRARSGSSVIGRDGLMRMLEAAREGLVDVVLVEALDRLSRDQEDLAGIYKRLTHAGIEIRAVHEGRADIVQIGIRGLVGALYLQDLAHKVRRGMSGVVRDGRNAGGKAYGYRPVAGQPGELEIVPEEAATVRRIFERYLAGDTPREIAHALNAEGVPPPRGRVWAASTINGNTKRGHGILQNEIYVGRLVWNRVHMVRDPDTGRRISRPNPESEWMRAAAPHLRIVEDDVFAAARERKTARAFHQRPSRKAKRILSGLLKCGECGGGMALKDARHGRRRIVCTTAKEAGTCTNRRAFYVDVIEQSVIGGLREQLASREAIALFIRTFNDEMRKLSASTTASYSRIESDLAAAQRKLDRAIDALINGDLKEEEAAARVAALRTERDELAARLAMADEPPQVVTLHPAAVDSYLASIDRLAAAVNEMSEAGDAEAMKAIRDLVETVTVTPSAGGGVEIEVRGHLSALLGGKFPPAGKMTVGGSVVAEARFFATPHHRPAFAFTLAIA